MSVLRLLLVAVLCLHLGAGQRTLPGEGERWCPVGWSRLSGQCFLFLLQPAVTWQHASLQCQLRGAHLARPDHTVTSTYKVLAMTKGWGAVWIGLLVHPFSGAYWFNGSRYQRHDYSDWEQGEPRFGGCVMMEAKLPLDHTRGTWRVGDCQEQHGFLCQTSPAPVRWHPDPFHCGQGWMSDLDTDLCYSVIDRPLTFDQASGACRDIGGHLASIDSLHQHVFFTQMARLVAGDQGSVWVDTNTTLVYGHSAPALRLGSGGECLSLRPDQDLPPRDVTSCHSLLPSLCHRPAVNTGCDSGGGWRKFGENCYKVFTQALPWTQASDHCSAEGGILARCHSMEEANFVLDLVTRVLHQSGSPGSKAWLWPRVSMLPRYDFPWKYVWDIPRDLDNYIRENPGFADSRHGGGERCVHVDVTLARLEAWDNALPCNTSLPFVCVRRPRVITEVVTYPPPPSTTVAPTTPATPPTTTRATPSDVTESTSNNGMMMSSNAAVITIFVLIAVVILSLIIFCALLSRDLRNQVKDRARPIVRRARRAARQDPSFDPSDAIGGPIDDPEPQGQIEFKPEGVRYLRCSDV